MAARLALILFGGAGGGTGPEAKRQDVKGGFGVKF